MQIRNSSFFVSDTRIQVEVALHSFDGYALEVKKSSLVGMLALKAEKYVLMLHESSAEIVPARLVLTNFPSLTMA